MRRRNVFVISALILVLVLTAGPGTFPVGRAGEQKKFPDPTPRKAEILKRFAGEFVALTPGKGKFPASFDMGSKVGLPQEMPLHEVTFRYPFDMAKYEVTQELYHVIMGTNPSKWAGPRNAIEKVSWHDANAFCKKVTAELRRMKLIEAADEIRLPTEAEWEYACRASKETAYSYGNDIKELTEYAWYKDNSKGHDPPVGMKKPNPWGLYDMHGYNWEWCQDDYVPTYKGAPADGSARTQEGAKEKVIRSGSWAHSADECRCAYRGHEGGRRWAVGSVYVSRSQPPRSRLVSRLFMPMTGRSSSARPATAFPRKPASSMPGRRKARRCSGSAKPARASAAP
jgi:formylglycine-generating enzyme required for sulfatase activity